MAATNLPTSGPASTTTSNGLAGVLQNFILQSIDSSISQSSGRTEVVVRLKGPYTRAVMAYQTWKNASTKPTISQLLTNAMYFQLDQNVDADTTLLQDSSSAAYAIAIDIQETDGWQCEVTITGEASSSNEGTEELSNSEVWQLIWQPASYDVYNFCANDQLDNAKRPTDQAPVGDADTASHAASIHIQQYLDQSMDTATAQNDFNYKSSVNSTIYTLNKAERLIATKKLRQSQPTYHYPVVRKSTTFRSTGGIPNITDCGENLDVIVSLPGGCPFRFSNPFGQSTTWQWLMVGDTVNMSRESSTGIVTYTRTQEWWGAPVWDVNFYGSTAFNRNNMDSTRWNFNEL